MTRGELQLNAVKSLIDNHRVILNWGTGTGKSRVAVEACAKCVDPTKILLLVSERIHKKNWEDEFRKWGHSDIFPEITVACYSSLHKFEYTAWALIIADEGHHLKSESRKESLKSITAANFLVLSATINNRSLLDFLNWRYGKFTVLDFSLQDAIDNKFVGKPDIFIIPLTLDNKNYTELIIEERGNKDLYTTIECGWQDRWIYKKNKKTWPNLELKIHCTQYQKYSYLCDQYNFYNKRYLSLRNTRDRNIWLLYGSKRKQYLGSLKTQFAKNVIDSLKNTRYMCFCTDIKQCAELGGTSAMHSKNKQKDNDKLINDFNDGRINELFAVGMGVEGINLNNIDAGLIVQLDGQDLKWKQKSGRIMRSKEPKLYILYYKCTRDEEFLKVALNDIDKNYIKTISIDELSIKD